MLFWDGMALHGAGGGEVVVGDRSCCLGNKMVRSKCAVCACAVLLVGFAAAGSIRAGTRPELSEVQTDSVSDRDESTSAHPMLVDHPAKDRIVSADDSSTATDEALKFDTPLDGLAAPPEENLARPDVVGMPVKPEPVPGTKYYCHHFDSCGTRPYPGPPTTASLHDGHNCVCEFENYCYTGQCYDPDHGSAPRTESDLDENGLCEYRRTESTGMDKCHVKRAEAHDPALKFFSDTAYIPKKSLSPLELAKAIKNSVDQGRL